MIILNRQDRAKELVKEGNFLVLVTFLLKNELILNNNLEQEPKPHLSAFTTKTSTIYFEPRGKQKIIISYLPLQFVKHTAIVLFTNESMGEFLYNLEGVVSLPTKSKVRVDEPSLDSRVKLIKINRNT